MKIIDYKQDKFDSLLKFNGRVFPFRDKISEYLEYNFKSNPVRHDSVENIIIAENEEGEIIGQFLLIHTFFFYSGIKHKGVWGVDFIVDEAYRGSYAGSVLAKKVLRTQNYFTIGPSEISQRIHLALKQKIIGSIIKYIRLNSVFSILKFLIKTPARELYTYNFPDQVTTQNGRFKRVFNSDGIGTDTGCWNSATLEFSRDSKFLDWRFFYYPGKYFVYQYFSLSNHENYLPVYFVVRPVQWKNVNCLLLVDYRYNLENERCFNAIINATVKLMKATNLSAIIACSSIRKHKKVLNRNMFFAFGEKMHILTGFKTNGEEDPVTNHKILLTFADCDCDYYFGNKRW
jgi:hypothetical protein